MNIKTALANAISHTAYNSISNIEPSLWNSILNEQDIHLDMNYLKAIEHHCLNGIEYKYLVFYKNEKAVGIAYLQLITLSSNSFNSNGDGTSIVKSLSNKINLDKISQRVLLCGNIYVTGQHGYCHTNDISEEEFNHSICKTMAALAKEKNAFSQSVSGLFFKDVHPQNENLCHHLNKNKYHHFLVEPNLIMPLHKNWVDFDAYLMDMTSKYRTKAKRTYTKSIAIDCQNFGLLELEKYVDDLQHLYDQLIDQVEFNLGRLNMHTFIEWKKTLGDKCFVRGYFLNDKLVGFLSGFLNGKSLDAHMVGMDYELNQSHGIYSRILYDYVKIGIKNQMEQISFGRTASQIKSSLGAYPVQLRTYVRHKSRTKNMLISPVFKFIQPTEWEARPPFKTEIEEELKRYFN